MANIKRIEGKTGISYQITVSSGRDLNGKQLRHFMTWKPEPGMTERQMQKAVEKAAFEFEQSVEQGFQFDRKQTFAQYAEYVLDLKSRSGAKFRTLERYGELLERINPAIGHIRLSALRPQHINEFLKNLSEEGIKKAEAKATPKVDFSALMKERKLTNKALSDQSGISPTTITAVKQGKKVSLPTAAALAGALGKETKTLFTIEEGQKETLSQKTILEHYRLIHTVLTQAEKEMLVPYNAAAKATPPKIEKTEVNYFQPEDIVNIREALETEPLKWKVITNLLLITGCRRGEIMGLQWDKIDFDHDQIKIDKNLLYSPKRGIYEDSTKTSSSKRFVKIPSEITALLQEYRAEWLRLKLRNGDRWQNTDFLFVKDNGSPMIPDSITQWLGKFSKRHGLPHINPHAFRHSMASILIHSGADIVSVSKRLGHAKTSTTTDIYSHVIAEADSQNAECLADALLRGKSAG